MQDTFWLVVTKRGVARIVKGKRAHTWSKRDTSRPSLDAGEYAVFLSVDVPDTVFSPRPLPSATITIPESSVIAPPVTVDVVPGELPSDDPADVAPRDSYATATESPRATVDHPPSHGDGPE